MTRSDREQLGATRSNRVHPGATRSLSTWPRSSPRTPADDPDLWIDLVRAVCVDLHGNVYRAGMSVGPEDTADLAVAKHATR